MAIDKDLLNPGEEVVVSTRTHPKALIVPVFVLLVLIAVAATITALVGSGILTLVLWVLALIGAIVWTLVPFLRWLTSTYTITSRRLITRQGIVTRTGHDIPLSRISDVSYELGLIDRILGCGTLVISDASERGRVTLPDVPHVERVQLQLSELLHHLHTGPPGGGRSDSGRRGDDGT